MSRSTYRFPKRSSVRRHLRVAAILLASCALLIAAYAQRSEPRSLPAPPKDASYILPDGSIYFAGNDLVDIYFQKLNALFIKAHPGFKFKSDMQDSNLALAGITSGKSSFGPIGRDPIRQGLDGFTALYGDPPAHILVAYHQPPHVHIF